ncbi:hypothetical protein [Marinibacterium sp. SX1]|uniref:hypothetical protein n=1 Tax=Marinibacterium sp. SX1 TaxID=3388424 RepID=UPI003D18381C
MSEPRALSSALPPARRRAARTALAALLSGPLLAAGADTASAGAWPRAQGTSFLSMSYQLQLNDTTDLDYTSIFYEYGLTDTWTIGFDGGHNPVTDDSSPVIFLRHPIFPNSGPNLFAAEIGLGAVEIGGELEAVIRPGFSWGRGYQAGFGSGWMGVESSYAFRGDGSQVAKLDATLGYNHAGGSLSFVQVQTYYPVGDELSVAVQPTYVQKVSERLFVEMGANYKLTNGAMSVKLGIWTTF